MSPLKPQAPSFYTQAEQDSIEAVAMSDTAQALADSMDAESPIGWGGSGGPGDVEPMGAREKPSWRGRQSTVSVMTESGPRTCHEIYTKFHEEFGRYSSAKYDFFMAYWNFDVNRWEDAKYEMRDALSAMKMWRDFYKIGKCGKNDAY